MIRKYSVAAPTELEAFSRDLTVIINRVFRPYHLLDTELSRLERSLLISVRLISHIDPYVPKDTIYDINADIRNLLDYLRQIHKTGKKTSKGIIHRVKQITDQLTCTSFDKDGVKVAQRVEFPCLEIDLSLLPDELVRLLPPMDTPARVRKADTAHPQMQRHTASDAAARQTGKRVGPEDYEFILSSLNIPSLYKSDSPEKLLEDYLKTDGLVKHVLNSEPTPDDLVLIAAVKDDYLPSLFSDLKQAASVVTNEEKLESIIREAEEQFRLIRTALKLILDRKVGEVFNRMKEQTDSIRNFLATR